MGIGGPEFLWAILSLLVTGAVLVAIAFVVYVIVRRGVAGGTRDAGVNELARELAEARERAARAETEVKHLRERLEQQGTD